MPLTLQIVFVVSGYTKGNISVDIYCRVVDDIIVSLLKRGLSY